MPVAQSQDLLLPSFDVLINGSPLPVDATTHVISITVDSDVNLPGMFTMTFTGLNEQAGAIAWLDDQKLFGIGNVVEVKLGYVDHLTTLIVGEITGLEPEFTCNSLPSFLVRGYDRRHRLQRGRKVRTFVQQRDSDIAAQIASEVGLTAETRDSEVVHDYVLQANQSDWEFLQTRASQIQYEVVVENKTLFFRPVGNAESEALTLTLENGLLEFYPRLSSMGVVSEVTVRGWNPKDKTELVGQAKTGDEVSTMAGEKSGAAIAESAFSTAVGRVSDCPIMNQAEADQIAKARFNQGVLEFITGEGVCLGNTNLQSGKLIKIDGIGKRFSGQYYVTSASHRYGSRGYYTHFTVRRNAL